MRSMSCFFVFLTFVDVNFDRHTSKFLTILNFLFLIMDIRQARIEDLPGVHIIRYYL